MKCGHGLTWIPSLCSLQNFELGCLYAGGKAVLTLNPSVPQPGACPTVMSVRPVMPLEYKRGFRNPKGGWPEDMRASFNIAMIAAAAGAEADVPET